MENIRVVFVTLPSEKAEDLAKQLVQDRHAACVNVVPAVKSYYCDSDKMAEANESLIIIKTTQLKIEGLVRFVRSAHPYDIPEIITIPVAEGLPDYINWVIEEMGKVTT
ncbi:MAG: divalent-cation tolerance protein CutA [bacterium]|nr:divalent-cation tolerance protein CutA [bacterium]